MCVCVYVCVCVCGLALPQFKIFYKGLDCSQGSRPSAEAGQREGWYSEPGLGPESPVTLTYDGWRGSLFPNHSGGRWSVKKDAPVSLWVIHLATDKLSEAAVQERRKKEVKNLIHYVKFNLMRKYQNMSTAPKTGGWGRGWGIRWWCSSAAKPGVEAERLWALGLRLQTTFPTDSTGGQAELRASQAEWSQGIQQTWGTYLKALLPSAIHLHIPFFVFLEFRLCIMVGYT